MIQFLDSEQSSQSTHQKVIIMYSFVEAYETRSSLEMRNHQYKHQSVIATPKITIST